MPLSSASNRAALVIPLLATLISCASAPPDPGMPQPGAVAGTIRVSGSHPYERQLVLAGEEGLYMLLRAPALEGELLRLEGQMVRVHGMLGGSPSGPRELSVEWYELMAPPGHLAAVGTLGAYQDTLLLRCDPCGERVAPIVVLIEGPLRESIEHFIGYRVWVVGERLSTSDGEDSETAEADEKTTEQPTQAEASERLRVVVREYGVLGPPTSPLRDAPHSTLPDSSRK